MIKQITNYTFDASAKTITFTNESNIELESIKPIINVTDGKVIYNGRNKDLGGSASTNVLTLDYDTRAMSDSDDLQIYYDDGLLVATEDKQDNIIDNQTNGDQISKIHDGSGNSIISKDGYLGDDFYASEIVRGNVSGAQPFSAYGDFDTGGAVTNNIVQPAGMGATINVATGTGVQMSIVSTSANDASDGTGIRVVHLHYIDANGDDQNEEVTLNGTTPVLTTATNIRFIQCMHMAEYGSWKKADGIITASNGGKNYSVIESGKRRCTSSARMVPAGKRLMIKNMNAGSTSGTADARVTVKLVTSYFEGHDYTDDEVVIPLTESSFQDNSAPILLDMPFAIPSGAVVAMEANSDKGASVVASYYGYIENN